MKRNPIGFIRFACTVLILAVAVELVSFLLIKTMSLPQSPFFNRNYSPCCVFENTPGYTYHNCTGIHGCDNKVTVDANGFITDNEVTMEKDKNTYRIFLVGGSAVFGNGQSVPYNQIKPYPQGIYTFGASIAGLLEKKLQAQFPALQIEVINACASGRTLNQSIGLYQTKLRNFKPDMVVSLDGMNETVFFGKAFETIMFKKLENYYKDLQQKTVYFNKKSPFFAVELYKLLSIKKMNYRSNKIIEQRAPSLLNFNYDDYCYNDYLKIKSIYIKNAQIFLDNVLKFNNICNDDGVSFVFGLQPLLYRQLNNKKLSQAENKMRMQVNPVNIGLTTDVPSGWLDTINYKANLLYKFFFDDYLSDEIRNKAEGRFTFIDFNKEISNVTDTVDFYTDYCHLTLKGNEIVAEILSKKVSQIIGRNLKNSNLPF